MNEPEQTLEFTKRVPGSGLGPAQVWEGYDHVLQRRVLVKKIEREFAQDPELRPRFEREARAAAKAKHPNIVEIYELRARGDELMLIFEWVDGKDVRALLKDHGRFPLGVAAAIAGGMLSGLDRAHAMGVLHRDLKPANVMVSDAGEVKITDFGTATLKDQPALALTQQGLTGQGTLEYWSPEQYSGEQVTEATDLFATGLVLFEMLTGRPVHEGQSKRDIWESLRAYKVPALDAFRDAIPPPVQPVLARLLDPKPAKRYASAHEARDALSAAVGGFLPPLLIADTLFGKVERKSAVRPSARVSRRAWLVPFLGFLIVAVVVLLVVKPSHDGKEPAKPDTTAVGSRADTVPAVIPETAIAETPTTTSSPPGDTVTTHPVAVRPDTTPSAKAVVLPDSGFISVWCKQEANVNIAGLRTQHVGQLTPIVGIKLPVGEAHLSFVSPDIDFPVHLKVSIAAADTARVRVNLDTLVARLWVNYVRPWPAVEVYLDGRFRDATPMYKPIYISPGTHRVVLRNQMQRRDSLVIERMFGAKDSLRIEEDLSARQ